uniref:Uncharacterized protein n=1 Tax=Ixodes ricinus TaxID=34613 RepID=A0A0K8R3I1_IXORI
MYVRVRPNTWQHFVPSAWTIPHPHNQKTYRIICKHLLALPKTEGAVRIPTATRPTQADIPSKCGPLETGFYDCSVSGKHVTGRFYPHSTGTRRQCWQRHLRRRCTGMPLVTAPHVDCLSLPLLNVEGKPLKTRCNIFSGPSRSIWNGGAIR